MNRQTRRNSMIRLSIFTLLLLVTPLLYSSIPVDASIVWSDDFNDGNYDGWRITGLYGPVDGDWVETVGTAEVIDGELWFTGEQHFRNFSYAVRECTVAYGSWSFDVKVRPISGSSNHTHIYFLDSRAPEDIPDFQSPYSSYDIFIYSAPWTTIEPPDWMKPFDDTAPSILLVRRIQSGGVIIGNYQVDEINGLYRFNVTRDETGRIQVFVNDTLRIDVTEQRDITPRSFYLHSEAGIGYDNVVVRQAESETNGDLSALLGPVLMVGSAGAAVIIVVLVIWKRRQPS
ncbi:MAG: hypothetical protein ACFFE6_06450 [Candidatus Thorarchaeota archaeon]